MPAPMITFTLRSHEDAAALLAMMMGEEARAAYLARTTKEPEVQYFERAIASWALRVKTALVGPHMANRITKDDAISLVAFLAGEVARAICHEDALFDTHRQQPANMETEKAGRAKRIQAEVTAGLTALARNPAGGR